MALIQYEKSYSTVHNKVLNDARLSSSDKGVLAYLNSKPNGWDFSSVRVASDHRDGVHSIRASLKTIEELGYLKRKRHQSGKMDYILVHPDDVLTSTCGKPHIGKTPLCSFAKEGKPLSAVITPISKTEDKKDRSINKTDKKNKQKKAEDLVIEIPVFIDASLWEAYLEMRKKLKAVNSPLAIKSLIKKLTANQAQANAMIEQSLVNSWKGIFDIKARKVNGATNSSAPAQLSQADAAYLESFKPTSCPFDGGES